MATNGQMTMFQTHHEKDWTEDQIPPPSWNKFVITSGDSEPILTSLVRKCYLEHLRKVLIENIVTTGGPNPVGYPNSLPDVNAYAFKLEEQALRLCMVTSLYQRVMLQFIGNVQKKTKERKAVFDNFCPLTVNTPTTSEADNHLTFEPFLTPPADHPHLSTKFRSPPPQEDEEVSQECMIPEECLMNYTHVKSKATNLLPEAILSPDSESTINFCSPASSQRALNQAFETSLDTMEEELARLCGEDTEKTGMIKSFKSSPISPHDIDDGNSYLPIDVKKELSVGTSPHDIKPEIKPVLTNILEQHVIGSKSQTDVPNWKLLRMRNEAELERKLKTIVETAGIEKRERLERRFLELFGPEDSIDGKRKDREEIAAFTVKHLMPMYKKQKIASKDLFKKLAKHISSYVMEKISFPDEKDVESRVREIFSGGRSINSDSDIYHSQMLS